MDPLELRQLLAGSFRGPGRGDYPTIEPFDFLETVTFTPIADRPLLAYTQRTTTPDGSSPMHAESGWLRLVGPGAAELVVAQPTGVTEVHTGTVTIDDGGAVDLRFTSTAVVTTATAKRVDAVERRFTLDGDILTVELSMAAVGVPMGWHLESDLRRSVTS
jgi:hypothetical protein